MVHPKNEIAPENKFPLYKNFAFVVIGYIFVLILTKRPIIRDMNPPKMNTV
jgi:hypothetical protein